MRRPTRAAALTVLLAVLVSPSLPHRPSAALSVVPDTMHFPRCEEVIAFASVPVDNVKAWLPQPYHSLMLHPNGRPDRGEVTLRSSSCELVIDGNDEGLAEWGEVRITLTKPDDGDDLDWYELAWVADNQRFNSWAKAGTDLDGVLFFSKDVEFSFNPDAATGVDDEFFFTAPAPTQWAFDMMAVVRRADGPAIPLTGSLWRETSEGTVRFQFSTAAGDQFGVASGEITTHPGTDLAALLRGGDGCNAEGTRCEFSTAIGNGLSVTVNSEDFSKEVSDEET